MSNDGKNLAQDGLTSLVGTKTVAADGSINNSTAYFGKGPAISFSLSSSNALDHNSLLFLMYWLPTVTSATLTLHATAKARLDASEIAIATAKGWTIA